MAETGTITSSPALLPLLKRLERHGPLAPAAREALVSLPWFVRCLNPTEDVFPDGRTGRHCGIVVSGVIGRTRILPDGSRQIVAVHMKGDSLCLGNILLPMSDCAMQALTRAEAAVFPLQAVERLTTDHPGLGRAIWAETLLEAAIQREWTVNVGRRNARARIAHLLCELAVRMKAAGISGNGTVRIPLTQEQLADAVGLTPIHVNRTLQALRADNLIGPGSRPLAIPNLAALEREARFQRDYLHPAVRPVA